MKAARLISTKKLVKQKEEQVRAAHEVRTFVMQSRNSDMVNDLFMKRKRGNEIRQVME